MLTVCAPSNDNPSFDVWQLTVTVTDEDNDERS
jgi:hypothetical protein